MDEELRFHVQMQTAENVRAGMSAEEARRRALIAVGGVERFKEEWRDARGVRWLEDLGRDIRYAVRRLVRQPGFTVPAVLTLAIGIGAVAAIFTLVNAVLLRPLPYPHANRLVAIWHTAPGLGISQAGLSDGIYLHYLKYNRVFEAMGLYHENDVVNLTDGGTTERIHLALGRMTGGRDWQRAQRALVAVQVALALTLLIASALMVQSFWRLAHAPLGFDPMGVLTFQIVLDGNQSYQDVAHFHARLLDRLRAVPGVSAAGAAFNTPLSPTALGLTGLLDVENVPHPPDKVAPSISINVVTPGYFRAMGIPLVRGRTFRPGELLNGAGWRS